MAHAMVAEPFRNFCLYVNLWFVVVFIGLLAGHPIDSLLLC